MLGIGIGFRVGAGVVR